MGLLANAGLAAGLGQGITETGQAAQKLQNEQTMAEKVNELAGKREESYARLKSQLEAQNQQAAEGQRETFESAQIDKKLKAGSAVATAKMGLEASENEKTRQNKLKIAQTLADARKYGADARSSNRQPPKLWTSGPPIKLGDQYGGKDSKGNPLPPLAGRQISTTVDPDGNKWLQLGDGRVVPYDATSPDGYNPNWQQSYPRAPAGAVRDVLANPALKTDFVNKYGHLPAGFTGAENSWIKRTNPNSSPTAGNGGGADGGDGSQDNAEQSTLDSDAPSFQSGAGDAYSSLTE
jgi:hypothetical protein